MHISLDSALGRQKRLNSVGESVLQIAPDAAAAYSLRSLTGGDPDVVRVRRESDNTEKDFSGSQIESGEMARWVNEQPTLPLDLRELDTNTGERDGALIEAAAAYSLRKLKEDFTGDVVEVRRNVDGETEGFTAAEVTDGTLESFVNASFDDELPLDQATGAAAAYSLRNLGSNQWTYGGDTLEYESDFITGDGLDGWDAFKGTAEGNETQGGRSGCLKFTTNSENGEHLAIKKYTIPLDSWCSLSYEVYYPSTNDVLVDEVITSVQGAVSQRDNITPDTWHTIKVPAFLSLGDYNAGNNEIRIRLGDTTTEDTGGDDVFYIRNVKVYENIGDTEYLPSGKYVVQVRRSSDDAVQSFTASEVADGTLEDWTLNNDSELLRFANQAEAADKRMYFDGINDSVDTGYKADPTSDFFVEAKFCMSDFVVNASILNDAGAERVVQVYIKEDSKLQSNVLTSEGFQQVATSSTVLNKGEIYVVRLEHNASESRMTLFVNGIQESTGTYTGTFNPANYNNIRIGAFPDGSLRFNGVIYDVNLNDESSYNGYGNTNADWTDQTGSNDGTVYGSPALFSGQGFDGHVRTWYDQSGSDNHAVQTTAANQPKIVDGGDLVRSSNGNPEVDFDGTQEFETISGGVLTNIQDTFTTYVATRRNSSDGFVALASSVPNRLYIGISYITVGDPSQNESMSFVNDEQSLGTVQGAAGSYTMYKNGAQVNTTTTDETGAGFFKLAHNSPDARIAEFIIYDSDQSDKRRAIEENIANHYDISLAAFSRDGFVKTWYDQTESRTDDPQNITGFLVERSNDIMNGEWDKVADVNGKVAFTHADDVNRTLNWTGTRWEFKDSSTVYYYSTVDTTYPFDVSNEWVAVEGSGTPDFESFDGGWYDPLGRGGMLTMHADIFQPTIVRNGTYLGEIDFDESNDKLNAHFELDIDPADSGFASIVVARVDSTDTTKKQTLLQNSPSGSRHLIQWQANGRYQFYARDAEGDTKTFITNDSFGNDEYKVFTTTIDSNSLCRANVNGFGEVNHRMNESVDFGSVDSTANSDEVVSPSGNPFMGAVKEMIFYLSDQSDNRTAIEANIGETYGITAIPAANDTVNGYVQTWYDQSGEGNDVVQTTAANQPKIVNGGSLVTGGMRFDDNQFLETVPTFTYGSGTTLSTFLVNSSDGDESAYLFRFVSDYIVYNTGGGGRRVFAGTNANAGNVTGDEELWTTISELNTAGGTSNFYVDGTLASAADAPIGTKTVSNRVLNIGGSGATTHWNGTVNEVIFYATDQSSNRTDIETNIINHYDI
jgi:hypothetical protein